MTNNLRKIVHRDFWNNHLVEIEDKGDYRSLYFGEGSLQSRMSFNNPYELVLSYTRYMAFALLLNSRPQNILIVGIGAGSLVRFFHHHFAECQIDAVDYSEETINAAKGYFQLPEDERITIYCTDGRSFLQNSRGKQYDIILIDAFDDQGMAPTVYSDLFFDLCTESLGPEGLISCNLWSNDRERLQEIKASIACYFTSSLYLPVPDRGNIIGLAMPYATPWPRICLKKKEIARLSQQYNINFRKMIRVAKSNNLSLTNRIATFLN